MPWYCVGLSLARICTFIHVQDDCCQQFVVTRLHCHGTVYYALYIRRLLSCKVTILMSME